MRRTLAVLVLLLSAGCSSDTSDGPHVFAASSLTEAFRALDIEADYSFGASSRLAAQVLEGAPADVLATADDPTMQRVVDAGLAAGPPVVFALNRLAIAVPRTDPAGIRGLADLARPGLRVVLAAPAVPAGRYAAEALAAAGVQVQPLSLEPNVKAVAGKVASGEADAGIVYVTDVRADRRLAAVPLDVETRCWVVALRRGGRAAREFVDYMQNEEARRTLARHGFGLPG